MLKNILQTLFFITLSPIIAIMALIESINVYVLTKRRITNMELFTYILLHMDLAYLIATVAYLSLGVYLYVVHY